MHSGCVSLPLPVVVVMKVQTATCTPCVLSVLPSGIFGGGSVTAKNSTESARTRVCVVPLRSRSIDWSLWTVRRAASIVYRRPSAQATPIAPVVSRVPRPVWMLKYPSRRPVGSVEGGMAASMAIGSAGSRIGGWYGSSPIGSGAMPRTPADGSTVTTPQSMAFSGPQPALSRAANTRSAGGASRASASLSAQTRSVVRTAATSRVGARVGRSAAAKAPAPADSSSSTTPWFPLPAGRSSGVAA
ncbi:MAG: hypothetical protein QM704_16800 [Anaeromyxobacteraceae bacterium]